MRCMCYWRRDFTIGIFPFDERSRESPTRRQFLLVHTLPQTIPNKPTRTHPNFAAALSE